MSTLHIITRVAYFNEHLVTDQNGEATNSRVPVASFTDEAEASIYLCELEREAHEMMNPFAIGLDDDNMLPVGQFKDWNERDAANKKILHTWLAAHPHLTPPDFKDYSPWCAWYDQTRPRMTAAEVTSFWWLFQAQQIYDIQTIEVED